MGFIFTLVFVVAAYLNPETVFGNLVQYHVQVIVATITLLCSLPAASGSGALRMPQTYALIGLILSVAFSLLLAGWLGGVLPGVLDFVPNAMLFFFVVWNVKTRRQLQILIGVLLFCAVFLISAGMRAEAANNALSPYLLAMRNDAGQNFYRIRGTSFLNDPNDLAQFTLALIPMLFIFWKKGRVLLNGVLVYLPSAFLLYGIYLTHSRGAMVALMVAMVVAFRRKIGILPSLIGGGIVFVGLVAAGFSGGRDVSAGEDRVETWSNALSLIKSHPVFGVGFRRFTEIFPLTAHNTILMCAAEVGLVGLFCWMLFVAPTIWNLVKINVVSKAKSEPAEDAAGRPGTFPARSAPSLSRVALASPAGRGVSLPTMASAPRSYSRMESRGMQGRGFQGMRMEQAIDPEAIEQAEARRVVRLTMVALTGFFTAAWFLPRAYTMSIFLNVGIGVVAFNLAKEQGLAIEPLNFSRAAKISATTCLIVIALLYASVRIDHFIPK